MQSDTNDENNITRDTDSIGTSATISDEILHEETVPLHSRIWVSAADASTAILCSIAEGAALTYYFTRVMGLAPHLASIVWLLFGIWNAFNDPLFGYISDRTRSKLGRRIPYIRYGAPLYQAPSFTKKTIFSRKRNNSISGNRWERAFATDPLLSLNPSALQSSMFRTS